MKRKAEKPLCPVRMQLPAGPFSLFAGDLRQVVLGPWYTCVLNRGHSGPHLTPEHVNWGPPQRGYSSTLVYPGGDR